MQYRRPTIDWPAEFVGLEDGESEDVEGFLGMPAELGAIDPDEKDTVGNLGTRIAGRFGEAWDLAFHATASCFGCE